MASNEYFSVSLVNYSDIEPIKTPQLIRCRDNMTFNEIFNITQTDYALETFDDYAIFLTKFD